MTALAIAKVELVRLFRERANLFFVLVMPLLLVAAIGAAFGGGTQSRVGIVAADDGAALVRGLVAALDGADGVEVVTVADQEALERAVARGQMSAGVVIPPDLPTRLASGNDLAVGYVGRGDATAISVRVVIEAALADQSAVVTAARFAGDLSGGDPADLLATAGRLQALVPGVEVTTTDVGGDPALQELAALGRFDLGASSQLFLFVFLNALASGAALIQTRRLGIAHRMLATPAGVPTILAGQAAGRYLIAVFQAGYIIVASTLLFGVQWGDPLATGSLVLIFCAVAAGAGLLLGSVLENDSQAAGIGVGLGLVLAALGGSMMALDFFPDGMRRVARFTPHGWANEAMAEIVRRGGGVADVVEHLAVLGGFAVVLVGAATVALTRTLSR